MNLRTMELRHQNYTGNNWDKVCDTEEALVVHRWMMVRYTIWEWFVSIIADVLTPTLPIRPIVFPDNGGNVHCRSPTFVSMSDTVIYTVNDVNVCEVYKFSCRNRNKDILCSQGCTHVKCSNVSWNTPSNSLYIVYCIFSFVYHCCISTGHRHFASPSYNHLNYQNSPYIDLYTSYMPPQFSYENARMEINHTWK